MDTGQPLVGQVAVVTGAGRGIGAAIARKLAQLGATTVLCGRTQSALDATAQAIANAGGKTEVIPCDVTVLHQLEYAAARVDSTWGRLDILVNNAGVGAFTQPLHKFAPEEWERVLNTNLRGVYFAIRAFVPLMIRARSGHVINISSLAGKECPPQRRRVCRFEVGTQRLDLFRRRGTSPAQYPGVCGLSGFHRNRTEPTCRQGSSENAATG